MVRQAPCRLSRYGDQFLKGIDPIAEALAERATQPTSRAGSVQLLVGFGRRKSSGVSKASGCVSRTRSSTGT